MSNARTHARNLAANWTGHAASLGVMFFLSPFIVHTLGPVEYGIWSLMIIVTGYLGILDLGIRASTGRHIALYLGREDHRAVDSTVRTSLGVIAAASAAMLAAGVVLGFAFPRIFPDTPARYHDLVKVLLPLLALGMGTSALGAAFSSVLAAHERFVPLQAVGLAVLGLRTAGTVVLLLGGYGIVGLTVLTVACNVVALLGNGLLAKRVYPALRIWPLEFSRPRLKELFGYGTAAFISGISYRVIHQTGLIVVGLLIGVASVTTYSIAGMLVLYTWGFIELISRTVFPSLQRAAGRGEEGAVQWLYLRQARVVFAAGVPVYVGFIAFGDRFIRLWMGPEFAPAAVVLAILSAARLYSLLEMPAWAVLAATGHVWTNVALAAAEAALNLALAVLFVMVFGWGLAGVAAGTLVALVVTSGTFIPVLACHWSRLRMWRLAHETVLPAVVTAGLFGAWCWAVRNWIPGDTWPLFAAQVGLALAGYAPVCLLALVPLPDRQRLLGVLRARLAGLGSEPGK